MPKAEKKQKAKNNEPTAATAQRKENQCSYFVESKRRFCPFLLSKSGNSLFCPQHSTENQADRAQCAWCKTSVFAKDLNSHTQRCNLRPTAPPSYFEKDVNIMRPSRPVEPATHIRDLSPSNLATLFEKIRASHTSLPSLVSINYHTPSTYPIKPDPTNTNPEQITTSKHKLQINSLLSRLSTLSLLSPSNTYVEMGCGTAEFSHHVNETVSTSNEKPLFVLVDRGVSRWKVKMDRGRFVKIKIDIKDFALDKCLEEQDGGDGKVTPVVCISKHLCGGATDLTLRCLEQYVSKGEGRSLKGILIALCCHHRCTFESYVNPEFFTEKLGFTSNEFSHLCYLSSWGAVKESISCLDDKATRSESKGEEEEDHGCALDETDNSADGLGGHFSGLNVDERRMLGRQVKDLFNAGRVEYLKQTLNFKNVYVEAYCDVSVTPENMVLMCSQ
ncbi:DUF715-domain-containing protein [Rhizoclosmatium globosum]|uniref:tRNA:m(4)X modification enzyme TRM13 n=1 Tax=Rhizoclosmatium globosum TaxID=329046 RepID=A0A1Y2C6G6_9FUNG|nr:DUF715-domain-containing protein [Rhizoclosmatium globosum]|eukprot:ORY42629.1 DUF715-domain-containing protein [Rhizoclosmatium globosum]